jgi:hypothetical protein
MQGMSYIGIGAGHGRTALFAFMGGAPIHTH